MKFTGLVRTTNTLSRFVFPAVLGIALATGNLSAQASEWFATGDLNKDRSHHTMTLLPDGQVLAAGGYGTGGTLGSAELYDPGTGSWSATGSLLTPRGDHTATLLPNGLVLVAGGSDGTVFSLWYQYPGQDAASAALATAQLYDPATGAWRPTGSLNTPRYGHRATLLANGWVLVTGGCCDSTQGPLTALKSAELYDPETETWTPVASMSVARDLHSATLLADGSVLVAGGQYPHPQALRVATVATAEIYTFDPTDPSAGTWHATGSMLAARSWHGAATLPDGTVLVTGGYPGGCCAGLQTTEAYDPVQETWRSVGAMTDSRMMFTATPLADDTMLVTGGYSCCSSPDTVKSGAEIYDADTHQWAGAADMLTPRVGHAAVLLQDGRVLVAGGVTDTGNTAAGSAEIFEKTSTPPANQYPRAAFDSVCTGLDCTFTDHSTDSDGTVVSWNWGFGDGNSSVEQSPTHTYANAGTYTVSLTVTDDDNANGSASHGVTVNVPPAANQAPTATFTLTCTDLDCDFTDGSTDGDGSVSGWSWDFGDGGNSTARNPNHSYAAAGTNTVTLTVTDDDGATGTVSQDVTVTAGTSPPVEASFASIAAEDGWVRESGESSGVGGRRNTGGSGSTAVRMGDHKGDQQYKSILSFDTSSIPDGATITRARLELVRGGNTGQDPFNTHGTCYVDIKTGGFSGNAALENADFQDPADAAQVATVSGQGGSGTLYRVDLDAAGGFINQAGRTQLRLYFSWDDNDDRGTDIAGFYSANNSNAARHPRLLVTYAVSDPLPANQAPTAAFTPECADLACVFTDGSTDSDGTVVGWEWVFGDGNTSAEPSPNHTYSAAGTYSVSLTVTDGGGATDNVAQNVTVGALTSTTYHPEAIDVSVGSYDWGSLGSFTNQGDDTYDVASAQATESGVNGSATDWEAHATLSSPVDGVRRLSVHYEGQYSVQSVSQALSLYNYEKDAWELVDTRMVGEGDDVVVRVEIATNPQRYVSSSGEMRARVRGVRAATQEFFVWANYLAWEVEATGG